MLHHHGRQPSSTRAVHVVLAKGASELMSIFITASMELLSSAVAWWLETPKKLAHARPGCSARLGSIRSAPGASPTSSLAARTAGSTWQPHRALGGRPWLTRSTAFARCRPRVDNSRSAMQHAGGASRASMLRRRGAGTLLVFGDQSAALAPIAMSPSPRSSAHGCWEFRIASKHSHCLGWRISVSTALMT